MLTLAAEEQAQRRLSPTLLNHSYRTYVFGAALGTVEHIDVDQELLFAAAMLHDIGLAEPARPADFTLASARVARDVAETVGLSTAATETIRSAITMHHTPGVTTDGRGRRLPAVGRRRRRRHGSAVLEIAIRRARRGRRERPRLGFKREFSAAFRAEAAAVPAGRARLLRRYGAFDLAIKLAPFSG